MLAKLLGNEEANAALPTALAGAIAVLVTNGSGLLSLQRIPLRALSNPVPKIGPSREPAREPRPAFADTGFSIAA